MANDKPYRFAGVTSPNTTQVPDQYLDELLPDLSGAELKVLLYITRRTFGFKKASDTISLSQMLHGITTRDGRTLDRGVGLSKKTLLQAITSLKAQQIILASRRRSPERGDEPTVYSLNIAGSNTVAPTTAHTTAHDPVGEKVRQGGGGAVPPRGWGSFSPTQQTGKQQTAPSKLLSSNSTQRNEQASSGPDHGDGASAQAADRPALGDTPYLDAVIEEFSIELDDTRHLRSNRTQAHRLLAASGLSESGFVQRLYEARSILRDQLHRRRLDATRTPVRTRPAFFWTIVRDVLGLRTPRPT